MIEETWERMMQDELDGTNSPAESARLHAWLAGDEAGRARFTELRALFEALGRVGLAEAPAGIRESVVREIHSDAGVRPRRAGWFADLEAAFRHHAALRYTYPLAAGGIAGILAFSLLSTGSGPRDLTRLPVTGTMVPASPGESALSTERLELEGAVLTLETRRSAAGLDLRLAGHSSRRMEIAVAYEGASVRPSGLSRLGPEARQVVLLPGRLQVEGSGEIDYALHFEVEAGAPASSIRVSLRAGTERVQRDVQVSKARL